LIEVSHKIIDYLNKLFTKEEIEKYLEIIYNQPTQYIRVNPFKTNSQKLIKELKENYNIVCEEIPYFPFALKITQDENSLLGKTFQHILGEYYIQSLSSMLPPLVLNPKSNEKILDLCASPGSKTTQLAELMHNKGELLANDTSLDRIRVLSFNIERMNIINAGIIQFKGEWLSKIYNNYFDKILVDAPCTGLGIIQKKGEISNWWSIEKAKQLSELQYQLLVSAIKMLKVGGEIVYSTCTLTVEENERVIDNIIKKYPVEIIPIDLSIVDKSQYDRDVPSRCSIETSEPFLSYDNQIFNEQIINGKRILPWKINSEGFFLIKLKKIDATKSQEKFDIKKSNLSMANKIVSYHKIKNLLDKLSDLFGITEDTFKKYKYILKTNDINFVSEDWSIEPLNFFHRIGIKLGMIDNYNEFTLHSHAAQLLQNEITQNIFQIENKKELKLYLSGGTIKTFPTGSNQFVVRYGDKILGTAIKTKEGLKSRFPRQHRTQEIVV